jgi:molecular chaperone DnaK
MVPALRYAEENHRLSWNQERLIAWIIDEFGKDQRIDLSKDKMAMQRVKEAAEKAEIALRSAKSTNINLPFITADASGPKHLNITLTQSKFEQIIAEFNRPR